jgi:hypothetical protein
MITQIGLVAGDIWHYLESHKNVTFKELAKYIQKPADIILMGLGWLAREGHVIVTEKDGDYEVSLRKKQ